MMAMQVPVGMQEGMSLVVQTPSGNVLLTIPQGLQPGDMFQFQVPVSPLVAQPGMQPMMQGGMVVNQTNVTNVTQQINATNVIQSNVGGPQAQSQTVSQQQTQTVSQPQMQTVPQPQPQTVPQPQPQPQTVPHGIWIVAWHEHGSAQGQAHRSHAAAEAQFSELDGGNWAACLLDPALLVTRRYGGWLDHDTNLKVLTDHAQRLALEAAKTPSSEGMPQMQTVPQPQPQPQTVPQPQTQPQTVLEAAKTISSEGMHAAHMGQPDVIARDETRVRLPRALEKGDCVIVAGTGTAATINFKYADSEIVLHFSPRKTQHPPGQVRPSTRRQPRCCCCCHRF